jgi:hypothetical protein
MHVRQLVIERAVATIGGQAFDDGVADVFPRLAEGLQDL